MSTVCQSCLGTGCIDVPDDSVLYSIQGDAFLFVIDCPAGFDCNGFRNFGQVSVQCCDELLTQAYEVPITTDAYNRIVAQLIAQCAARLPFCSTPTPPVSPGQPVIYYYSHPASCTVKCPQDGLPFEYTVPPGAVIGTTQAQADAGAHRIACNLATLHRICLSGLPKFACEGVAFSKNITATGARLATFPEMNFWQISSGALPDGLTFNGGLTPSNTVSITGTPTVPGTFTFTVQITDPTGDVMRKPYTICIIGVTATPAGSDSSHLPDATVGTPYTNTLSYPGCVTGLTFSVNPAQLPDGLVIDSTTGVISGTPTGSPGSFLFTVNLKNSAGTTVCSKDFTLTVDSMAPTVDAYWTLQETGFSTPRVDSVHAIPLTVNDALQDALNNTPGIQGNGLGFTERYGAAFFLSGSLTSLKIQSTNGCSVFGWFKVLNWPASPYSSAPFLVYFGADIGKNFQFQLNWDSTSPNKLVFSILDNNFVSYAPSSFSPTLATWYFFHVFWDPVVGKVGYSINNGAPVYDNTLGAVFGASTHGQLQIGQNWSNPDTATMALIIDEMGLKLDRVLTSGEQAFLYNSGAARTWPL